MNQSDISRDLFMLKGPLARKGYDWWWHSFTGYHRTTGKPRAFFIEYYVCNPELGGTKAILGQLPKYQFAGIRPTYALVKVGTWGRDARQIHNFYPISQFSCPFDELQVRIGECTLSEKHMKGFCKVTAQEALEHPEYMCDAGEMSWDLEIDKKIAYHVGYGASEPLRKLNAFEMFWHAEGIKTEYSGEVILDGEVYDVFPDRSYGYADKNWGADFTSPWLWISSCNLTSRIAGKSLENSAVEFGGGRPKVLGYELDRRLLGGLYYEGIMYDYNFSKVWTGAKVDFSFTEGEKENLWKLRAENKDSVLKLLLKCPKEEMLFINYEAPDGKKRHNRLWNGGTGYGRIKLYQKQGKERLLIDDIDMKNTGCEYGVFDSEN